MRNSAQSHRLAALGSLFVLALIAASVLRYPAAAQGSGTALLVGDVAGLLICAAFSLWASGESRVTGLRIGLVLGAVLATGHAVESFAPVEPRAVEFARGAGSVLLTLALLAWAGSAAWERTRSVKWAVVAGLWSGLVATLVVLDFAWSLNILFQSHMASLLKEPFAASGMADVRAFLVRNSIEATSEILLRMPVAAVVLSLLGGLAKAWMAGRSRQTAIATAWLVPVIFLAGAAALWYANSLERAARPPFILAGILAAAIGVCGAHPAWSALRGCYRTGVGAGISFTNIS